MTIAKYLDKTYPDTPTLFPPGTLAFHSFFLAAYRQVHLTLWSIVCCAVCYRLNPRSAEFYRRTREESEGKRLEDIRGDNEWVEAEAAYGKLALWLTPNGPGNDDCVMGEGICFADIHIVSGLMWAKTALGENSAEWARISSWHEGKWGRIAERFAKYTQVEV